MLAYITVLALFAFVFAILASGVAEQQKARKLLPLARKHNLKLDKPGPTLRRVPWPTYKQELKQTLTLGFLDKHRRERVAREYYNLQELRAVANPEQQRTIDRLVILHTVHMTGMTFILLLFIGVLVYGAFVF